MEDSTITLIVGLAGIAGTLASSAIGFYYTNKARKTPYQKRLYDEQLQAIKRIHKEIGLIKSIIPLVRDEDAHEYQKSYDVAQSATKNLIDIANEVSAYLPSELWVDLNRLTNDICEYLAKPSIERSIEDIRKIAGASGSIAIASRTLLGVDEATMETSNMLTNKSRDELISNAARLELMEIAKTSVRENME